MDGRREAGKNNPYVYLANNGPSTFREMPNEVNSQDRELGVRRFNMKGRGVYYIENKHSKKAVVEKWRKENQATIENKDQWAFVQLSPDRFKDVVKEVLDCEYPGEQTGGRTDNRPCPVCGEQLESNFPDHRPDCPGLD